MEGEFEELGRFALPSLLVMASLAQGPKHGYAIIKDVESFGGVRLGAGTLYGALNRLESRGLVEALPPVDRRRPYRLTPLGSEFLGRQLRNIRTVALTGLDRLAGS